MERPSRLALLLLGLGAGRAEAAIVGASVGGSLLLTYLSLTFLRDAGFSWQVPVTIATIVPLAVATPVAFAIMGLLRELDRSRQRAQQAASTDLLTGLYNRRSWIELAGRELQHAAARQLPAALLMLDVDHFKRINDVHGHGVGDAVLEAVGRLCRDIPASGNFPARWGGEEFVLLLPGTDRDAALQLAERMREGVLQISLQSKGKRVEVTASIGVAGALEDAAGHELERLLYLADAAMYAAKQDGRDRVSTPPQGGPDFGSTARMRRLTPQGQA